MIRSRGRRLAGGVCVLLAAAVILSAALYWNFRIRPEQERRMYPREYSELVEKYAFENSLPVELVFAVILTESSFRTDALSSAGAKGLMQITDDTNDWISRMQGDVGWLEDAEVTDELFDPETNIRRGCYFLAYLRGQFGFDEEALAAYNAGIGRVRNWLQEPGMTDSDGRLITEKITIAETRNYVRKVLDSAERYREIYSE